MGPPHRGGSSSYKIDWEDREEPIIEIKEDEQNRVDVVEEIFYNKSEWREIKEH